MLHRSLHTFIKVHHRGIAKVLLGSLAAVVVVGTSQGYPHGGEGGLDIHQGTQQDTYPLQDKGHNIDEGVGKPVLWGRVPQTS